MKLKVGELVTGRYNSTTCWVVGTLVKIKPGREEETSNKYTVKLLNGEITTNLVSLKLFSINGLCSLRVGDKISMKLTVLITKKVGDLTEIETKSGCRFWFRADDYELLPPKEVKK